MYRYISHKKYLLEFVGIVIYNYIFDSEPVFLQKAYKLKFLDHVKHFDKNRKK
jgi:hypothetical protein